MTKGRTLAPSFVLAALTAIAGARDAHAEPAHRLEPRLDAPIILVGGAVTSGFLFLDEAPNDTCSSGCDRSRVVWFDRWAAGKYSTSWGTVGNIATATTILFGPLVLTIDGGLRDALPDAVVVGEAMLMSSALQVLTSFAIPRPRPRAYGGDEVPIDERTDANAGRSFFSGHTANTMASVVATASTLHTRGRGQLGTAVLLIGIAGSAFTGTARVMAGSHFASDVVIGAAVGTGFGLLTPWLHSSTMRVAPMATADGGGAMLSGSW